MGNGALPNGPSYRAHPRLYHFGRSAMSQLSPLSAPERTWIILKIVDVGRPPDFAAPVAFTSPSGIPT
jgi:hypothetical protein